MLPRDLSHASLMRLFVRMVARADQWSAGRVHEAASFGPPSEFLEYGGFHVTCYRQVMQTRLQVLTDGEHIHRVRPQIMHDGDDLLVALSQADHQSRFGGYMREAPLERLKQIE